MTALGAPKAAPPRRRAFVSVGTKLTGAVLFVLSVVTVFAYTEVSHNERQQLLTAKEHTATVVTELFAAGVTAPLSFGDDVAVREHIALLMSNTNVVYTAVWRADGAHAAEKVAEVERGLHVSDPASQLPQETQVERTTEAVLVRQRVTSASGEVLGSVVVGFSMVGENAAIAAAQRRTLVASLATGLGLALLLLGLSRTLVVKRLAELANAAKRLEEGDSIDLAVDTNDEVGALSRAFKSMSDAIAAREAQISARNRDLRRVLDNVAEGLMTVRKDGTISDERSHALDEWFGAPGPSARVYEYFETFAPSAASLLRLGWISLQDDIMPVEVIIDQMSRRFERNARFYELDYSPIWVAGQEGQVLDEVLVVVRDVTARVERERVEQSQRDALNMFRRILVDPQGFRQFMQRTAALVDAIEAFDAAARSAEDGTARTALMRDIHTLKGDTGFYGIESVAALCHSIESRAHESGEPPSDKEIALLRAAWTRVRALATELEGGTTTDRIEIHVEEYERHLGELEARACDEDLILTVRSWTNELASRCLQRIAEQGRALARRLGKPQTTVEVSVTPPSLRLPETEWSPVWSVLSHVLRNTFDHGIELPDERKAAGKPLVGKVQIAMVGSRQGVELRVADDGRGIAWDKIRDRARELGLPYATEGDLEEALFTDRVSTRSSATETSGRGLGMGAFREVVRKCGGTVTVESRQGEGTSVTCSFPPSMIEWPRRTLASAASKVA